MSPKDCPKNPDIALPSSTDCMTEIASFLTLLNWLLPSSLNSSWRTNSVLDLHRKTHKHKSLLSIILITFWTPAPLLLPFQPSHWLTYRSGNDTVEAVRTFILGFYWAVRHVVHYLISDNKPSKDCIFFFLQTYCQGKRKRKINTSVQPWRMVTFYTCHGLIIHCQFFQVCLHLRQFQCWYITAEKSANQLASMAPLPGLSMQICCVLVQNQAHFVRLCHTPSSTTAEKYVLLFFYIKSEVTRSFCMYYTGSQLHPNKTSSHRSFPSDRRYTHGHHFQQPAVITAFQCFFFLSFYFYLEVSLQVC